jgi:effector-binding domain-containing protein
MPETVTLEEVPAETVAYKSGKGAYDLIPDTVQELNLWIRENGHNPVGHPVSVFLNNPLLPAEDLLWEIRIPLKVEEPISHPDTETTPGIKEIAARETLSTTHQGAFDTIGGVVQGMIRFMVANGFRLTGPPEQVLLKDPVSTPLYEMEGEVRLPVERRT